VTEDGTKHKAIKGVEKGNVGRKMMAPEHIKGRRRMKVEGSRSQKENSVVGRRW